MIFIATLILAGGILLATGIAKWKQHARVEESEIQRNVQSNNTQIARDKRDENFLTRSSKKNTKLKVKAEKKQLKTSLANWRAERAMAKEAKRRKLSVRVWEQLVLGNAQLEAQKQLISHQTNEEIRKQLEGYKNAIVMGDYSARIEAKRMRELSAGNPDVEGDVLEGDDDAGNS